MPGVRFRFVGALRETRAACRRQALARLDFCYALVTISALMPAHLHGPFRQRLDAFARELEASERAISRPSTARAWLATASRIAPASGLDRDRPGNSPGVSEG